MTLGFDPPAFFSLATPLCSLPLLPIKTVGRSAGSFNHLSSHQTELGGDLDLCAICFC